VPHLAKDLMSSHLITVSPEAPLVDVNRLFVEEELHGAPVVDDEGRLVGVVSTSDLLRAVEEEHEGPAADHRYFREVLDFSAPDWTSAPEDFQDRLSQFTVSDVMQTSVVTVTEDAPLTEIASVLREHRIHRVIVVRDGYPLGVVSSFDLLALLAKGEVGP